MACWFESSWEHYEFEISFKIHYRTSKTLFTQYDKEFVKFIEITDGVYFGGIGVVVTCKIVALAI